MTVIVTKMPGGVAQLFNPDTGKITYKCKADSAYLKIDAFDGIIKFNQKGSKAIVDGPKTALENCQIIKKSESGYKEALDQVKRSEKSFREEHIAKLNQEISELDQKLS